MSKDYERLLVEAVENGDFYDVQTYLHCEANPDAENNEGEPVLMTAIKKGDCAIVQELVEYRAWLDNTHHDLTPLMVAAQCKESEIFEYLLVKGADINLTGLMGERVLAVAAEYDSIRCMELLFELKGDDIDINHKDQNGETALMYAALNGRLEPLMFLLHKGADTTLKNNHDADIIEVAKERHQRYPVDKDRTKCAIETVVQTITPIKEQQELNQLVGNIDSEAAIGTL